MDPEVASVYSQGSGSFVDNKRYTITALRFDVDRVESYTDYITRINDYIASKMNEHLSTIGEKRSHFGKYRDSFGFSEASAYVSERELATHSLRYSPDGHTVAAGFGSGTLKIYDAHSFTERATVIQGKENGNAVTCIRFVPGYPYGFYASTSEGIVNLYDCKTNVLTCIIEENDNEINAIDINKENTVLVSGGKDAAINVYNISAQTLPTLQTKYGEDTRKSTGKNASFFPSYCHTKRIYAVKFIPDDTNLFLSGGWDSKLKLWDLRTAYGCVNTVDGPHISGDAIDIRGNLLVTGSWQAEDTITLWDLRVLKIIKNVIPINYQKLVEGIYTFTTKFFDRDETSDIILHGSLGYKTIDIISIQQSAILHSFHFGKSTVAMDSSGAHIVYGGTSNVISFGFFFMNLLLDYNEKYKDLYKEKEEGTSEEEEEEEEEEAEIEENERLEGSLFGEDLL